MKISSTKILDFINSSFFGTQQQKLLNRVIPFIDFMSGNVIKKSPMRSILNIK